MIPWVEFLQSFYPFLNVFIFGQQFGRITQFGGILQIGRHGTDQIGRFFTSFGCYLGMEIEHVAKIATKSYPTDLVREDCVFHLVDPSYYALGQVSSCKKPVAARSRFANRGQQVCP